MSGPRGVAERFHRFCVAVVARLLLGLDSLVAPTFLGFALINGVTFGFDLLLVSALHTSPGADPGRFL